MKCRVILATCSLLMIMFLSACNSSTDAANIGTNPVDPVFSDFYSEMGGNSILGPAISPVFKNQGLTYQYVASGLMAYDPSQMMMLRFHFSPIASIEWGINDLPEQPPLDPNIPFRNGHRIWEEVLSFYNRYGPEIIGSPITGIKPNDEKQRYEQYFEGLGFYRNYADPPGKIQLLPYGAWMCGSNCSYQPASTDLPASSYIRNYSETEQLFLQEAERLGYEFTGSPISSPANAADGNFEMVFENLAMNIDPLDSSRIKLRPLPSIIGIHSDPPSQEVEEDWLSFYPMGEGIGYSIPIIFTDFIENHGGMAYIGEPITNYYLLPDNGYSQCFTNLCLQYHPNAPEQLQVRPHTLGIDFLSKGENASVTNPTLDEAIQINVWERNPLIPSGEKQIISVSATQNNQPIQDIELSLLVKQPDGILKSYQLRPTDEEGMTSLELDPIYGPNGAIVQYEVCIINAIDPQVCFLRNYTIGNQ